MPAAVAAHEPATAPRESAILLPTTMSKGERAAVVLDLSYTSFLNHFERLLIGTGLFGKSDRVGDSIRLVDCRQRNTDHPLFSGFMACPVGVRFIYKSPRSKLKNLYTFEYSFVALDTDDVAADRARVSAALTEQFRVQYPDAPTPPPLAQVPYTDPTTDDLDLLLIALSDLISSSFAAEGLPAWGRAVAAVVGPTADPGFWANALRHAVTTNLVEWSDAVKGYVKPVDKPAVVRPSPAPVEAATIKAVESTVKATRPVPVVPLIVPEPVAAVVVVAPIPEETSQSLLTEIATIAAEAEREVAQLSRRIEEYEKTVAASRKTLEANERCLADLVSRRADLISRTEKALRKTLSQ